MWSADGTQPPFAGPLCCHHDQANFTVPNLAASCGSFKAPVDSVVTPRVTPGDLCSGVGQQEACLLLGPHEQADIQRRRQRQRWWRRLLFCCFER